MLSVFSINSFYSKFDSLLLYCLSSKISIMIKLLKSSVAFFITSYYSESINNILILYMLKYNL